MPVPLFLITIDTEGDDLWAKPKSITTKNAGYLPRFQSLCEAYNLKPTYLTNYEMANDLVFQEFGKDLIKHNTAEIGMHLHAWNSPPIKPLTEDDFLYHPYLVEYPENTMREKIVYMTDLLEDIFGVKMRSHRAGKWCFNETYAQILIENRYQVDCSVTPHFSRQYALGDPKQNGGSDFSNFPERAYFVDPENIQKEGDSTLLEIPLTILSRPKPLVAGLRRIFKNQQVIQRGLNLFHPRYALRPNGKNLQTMLHIVRQAIIEKRSYVEFMLHSSELMPAGSPYFRSQNDIEILYNDLDVLFCEIKERFRGATLQEYYNKFAEDYNHNSLSMASKSMR